MAIRLDGARPGQSEAIRTIIRRLADRQSTASIILPTGYGKSDVIRASALYLQQAERIGTSLVIVPNDYLRSQITEAKAVLTTAIRYGLDTGFRYRAITTLGLDYAANGEAFVATTIQLVQTNAQHFAQWIESMIHRFDRPVAVFVDEVHTHTDMNQWGDAIELLRKAGAYIVVLTATPYRDDGALPVGFARQIGERQQIHVTKTRPGSAPDKVLVQLYEGDRYLYKLIADYEHTFQLAWKEHILCHVSRHEFDVEVSIFDPVGTLNAPHALLSDLSGTDARRVLAKAVRHPTVVRIGCELLVARLLALRRANAAAYGDIAGIVFTANDESDPAGTLERNEHAEQIKATIAQIDPSLRVVIATSADDTAGKKSGRALLEQFVFHGQGDIVIVKQMGGVGLDADRLKVALDLSPVRSASAMIQRIGRILRPYKGMTIAHWIGLADALSRAVFQAFVDDQGGAAGSDLELVREYEKDREEHPPLPLFMVHGAEVGDMDDTKQNTAIRDELPLILRFLEEFPILLTSMTFPEIASSARKLSGTAPAAAAAPTNTGTQIDDIRANCLLRVGDLCKLRFMREYERAYRGSRDDSAAWGAISSGVWTEAKKSARIDPGLKIERITDVDAIERLRAVLDKMLDREMGIA